MNYGKHISLDTGTLSNSELLSTNKNKQKQKKWKRKG